MANVCESRLLVTGDSAEIERLRAAVAGTDGYGNPLPFDFEAIAPTPIAYTHDSSAADHWRKLNWGVEGRPTSYDVWIDDDEEGQIVIYFSTPWEPAVPVIETLAGQFPALAFDLCVAELDMSIAAAYRFSDGRLEWEEIAPTEKAATVDLLKRYWPEAVPQLEED